MLVTYLRPQRPRVAGLAALLLGSIGLQLYNPQILKQFIDSATHGASDRTLAVAAGLFLAIALIQQAASVAATYLSENIGWTATNAGRAELLWKIARQQSAELYGFLTERLAGTEDIRSSGAEQYTMRRLYERLGEQFRAERRASLTGRLVWTVADIVFTVAGAGTFLLAARLYHTEHLTVGTIYSIVFYLGLLFHPLTQITRQAEDLQKASAGIARIQELLDTRSAL